MIHPLNAQCKPNFRHGTLSETSAARTYNEPIPQKHTGHKFNSPTQSKGWILAKHEQTQRVRDRIFKGSQALVGSRDAEVSQDTSA